MPPERDIEHRIDLEPGAKPFYQKAYRMTLEELEELKRQLKVLIENGLIVPSVSPWGAPVLFAPKPGGGLRLCIDYRAVNKATVRNVYPLPRVDELLDRLHGARCFSKIDLLAGFWQIRLASGDTAKTAFNCRYGHFQWTVMPMGLTNSPATFQHAMNSLLHDLLDEGVVVYLDDILLYSRSMLTF